MTTEHLDYASRFIDRRNLLRIGSLASLGLSLPRLFQAEVCEHLPHCAKIAR